jgi:hypothetical protein
MSFFVNFKSAFLLTSLHRMLQRLIPDRHHARSAVVTLTGAKSKDVHELAPSWGAHACIAKEPCVLHHIVQVAIVCAWKTRLEASA